MTSNDIIRNDIERYLRQNVMAPRPSGLEGIKDYRISIELGRDTHSRNQVNALDKLLRADPTTKAAYTGLVGRRFCFAFDTLEEKNNFRFHSKKMLANKYQ
jgi:hypothetical protein